MEIMVCFNVVQCDIFSGVFSITCFNPHTTRDATQKKGYCMSTILIRASIQDATWQFAVIHDLDIIILIHTPPRVRLKSNSDNRYFSVVLIHAPIQDATIFIHKHQNWPTILIHGPSQEKMLSARIFQYLFLIHAPSESKDTIL